MSRNISLFHPRLYHLDHTEKLHSLGAPLIDGGVFIGTYNQDYTKRRISVSINDSGIWIARADKRSLLQIIVAPRMDGHGMLDKTTPAELLVEPVRTLRLGRSAMQGYMTIESELMRPDGLEDMREFADVLASRIEDQQKRA